MRKRGVVYRGAHGGLRWIDRGKGLVAGADVEQKPPQRAMMS